ncbi:hypothetical protein Y032_0003g1216 [Ancylostoma ceylanicum]|uniref:Uncharacterized protein n=1 Tax=Ancylostoma ceylanicum TaxID=53326 RepID=A0A016VWP8_9BILA|nr:hypothetical protein Y032_0003g1216 [Ancylostoma ceylanicum]
MFHAVSSLPMSSSSLKTSKFSEISNTGISCSPSAAKSSSHSMVHEYVQKPTQLFHQNCAPNFSPTKN